MKYRHAAAFTLIEVLVTTLVSSVVGGIIYLVASEGLTSFARNTSINRGYTDTRSAIDQISAAIQSAGHAPTLVNATGVPLTTTAIGTAAEGVRFYRYGSLPTYEIPSGKTTDTSLNINYTPAQATAGGGCPVAVGDLLTIPLLGFQATVASVTATAGSGVTTANLTFYYADKTTGGALTKGLPPANQSTVVDFTYNPKPAVSSAPTYYTALVYRQVAFITVPNATSVGGAQVRYYPQAMSSDGTNGKACGGLAAFNNSTAFNNAKNYSVIANLTTAVTDASLTPLKPFVDADTSNTLQINLCGTAPDYSNRKLSTSNTYTLMRSTVGSRCPIMVQSIPAIPL